jgi:hypothetical protein
MFAFTDTKDSPWWVVEGDDKRAARLNVMSHLLSVIPYQRLPFDDVVLPPRQQRAYVRPPKEAQTLVPVRYEVEDRRRHNGNGHGHGNGNSNSHRTT